MTGAPKPDVEVWLVAFKRARTTAHRLATSVPVSRDDRIEFLSWLAHHMDTYKLECEEIEWPWSRAVESDCAVMATWVRDDLDLDMYKLGDVQARAHCEAAGWP